MKTGKMFLVQSVAIAVVMAFSFVTVWAAGPLDFVKNIGKTVDADPNKAYMLTEVEGPYLIYVMSFSGPTAQQDAHSLVLELRKSFKWNAYVYEKNFVYDANKDWKQGQNPYFKTKFSKYQTETKTQFAVLIGNFASLDDKQFNDTLVKVRACKPASLKGKASETPFSTAFGLANPILPPENQRGIVDPFIESINIKRPYSLLQNRCRYTVQIATFTGHVVAQEWQKKIKPIDDKKNSSNPMTELEKGEQAAIALCKALREQGVEAYEFHDRYASIVTVGSFNYYAQRMPDGTTAIDPQVQQIIQRYQGQVVADKNGYEPVFINGIACDALPKIIEVPKSRR